jgi:hypothetical protein
MEKKKKKKEINFKSFSCHELEAAEKISRKKVLPYFNCHPGLPDGTFSDQKSQCG